MVFGENRRPVHFLQAIHRIFVLCLLQPCVIGTVITAGVFSARQEDLILRLNHGTDKETVFTTNQSDLMLHPGFSNHCRLSQHSYSGQEGSSIPEFQLSKTFVFISPGHRHRNVNYENITSPDTSCRFEDYASRSAHEKVRTFQEAVEMYQHMKRKNPFKMYKPYSQSEKCNEVELSPLGLTQLILLGQYISGKYSKLSFSVPSKVEKYLSAYSFQNEAAYQSGMALLHGLLHEKNFVHAMLKKPVLCKSLTACSCPKAEKFAKQIEKGVRKGFYLFKDTAKVDRIVNQKLGVPHFADVSPRDLVTFLATWVCSARSHPCKNGACLNMSFSNLDHLFSSAAEHFEQLTSSTIFKKYANLITYPLFKKMLTWLEKKSDENFSFVAVEEDFLAMVLSVLGISPKTVIPHASRLVFDVYDSVDMSKSPIIKVYYNGVDVTSKLIGWSDVKQRLTLKVMKDEYLKFIEKDFRNGSYNDECNS